MFKLIKNWRISWFLASRSILRGSKGTLALTILVMALSFINIIFMASLIFSMMTTMEQSFRQQALGDIVITPEDATEISFQDQDASSIGLTEKKRDYNPKYIYDRDSVQDKLLSVPGILASTAHYVANANFVYDPENDGKNEEKGAWTVKSINPEKEMTVTGIHNKIVSGKYLEVNDRDYIMVGRDISGGFGSPYVEESLGGIKVGDKVKLIFANGVQREYTIKGIFATKNMLADMTAFLSEKEMESILGTKNMASEILLRVENPGQERLYIEKIENLGIADLKMKSWQDFLASSASFTDSFMVINLILSGIGLIVAGAIIFIVIYINVVNKRKQIAILKAIGMEAKIIVNSYVLQSMFYAIIGISLGVLFIYGFVIPYFIANPMNLPTGDTSITADPNTLLTAGISLISVAILAGFFPAWMVSRGQILDAMRGE
jgi:putative ABC transport system permease protein